jgi:hypothetical protein
MNVNQQLLNQLNAAAQNARVAFERAARAEQQGQALYAQASQLAGELEAMKRVVANLEVSRSGAPASIQRVENIPGRRIPFDALVDIAIGDSVQSVQQGSITISQEGPFVGVSRVMALLSTFEFQYRDPVSGAASAFQGRSYGRYRPAHSAWDLNDSMVSPQVSQAVGFPGTGAPHVTSPGTASSFRSMEGDFRIIVENAGSSFPRSNQEVPSAFWSRAINEPFELGALDVFERGEVIVFKVLPLHPNNPSYGNLSAFGAPNASFPFVTAGFDAVEGVNDQNDANASTTDPVTRLANAIVTIGYHGYRIIQQPGLPG